MTLTRRTLLGALIAAMVLAVAPIAYATPPAESGAVVRGPSENLGFVYRGSGYIVLTGPELSVGCADEDSFAQPSASFVLPRNGTFQERWTLHGEGILVFEDTAGPALDDIWPWIAAACEAATDGDESTVPPQTVAEGEGTLTFHLRVTPDGTANIHNWINGKVVTSAGDLVHLKTVAKFSDGPNGFNMHLLDVDYGG